ncbi:centromere protein F [Cephus cinctus]|uniref:Centromere protein F n=1 Tax=Cephus cinctus TaxID=211228 RepID=A0AAJ7FST4_CEPCN|nr:centromere protein F [Cephus cinctus]
MSDNLLTKEKEFYRLNKELDQKSTELMHKVDSVINVHSNSALTNFVSKLSYFSPCTLSESSYKVTEVFSTENNAKQFTNVPYKKISMSHILNQITPADQTVEMKDFSINNITLANGNNTTNAPIVEFLKATIGMLYNELQATQIEYKKQSNYCQKLEAENKKLENEKSVLHGQLNTFKNNIKKLENINKGLNSKIEMKYNETLNLKRQISGLKKEIKTLNLQSNSYDIRLNRLLENNEKLQNALKFNRLEEKDLRDQVRQLQEDKRIVVKSLEKQRSELVQAFNKQTLLVDNLKKQKVYLTANKLTQFAEDNFSQLLNWKSET